MASTATREKKVKVVGTIKEKVQNANLLLITDFRGMTVAEMTEMRSQIRDDGGRMTIYKNTMSRLALKELNIVFPEAMLQGPSALINTTGDISKISKVVVKFAKETDNFKIRGGILESNVIDTDTIQALASLPSREELIAKVIGGIKAPITSFVAALSGPCRGLVYTLEAIKKQKETH